MAEITERRVVGETRGQKRSIEGIRSHEMAARKAEEVANPRSRLVLPWTDVRVESRTIVASEWQDEGYVVEEP